MFYTAIIVANMNGDWLDDIDDNRKPSTSATCQNEQFTPRRIPPQNILTRLRHREIHCGRPGTHYHRARQFYTNIFPNFTVVNIEKPPCFLRKFSPDGKHFIAFSSDQTSIEIYKFQGPAASETLLRDIGGECLSSLGRNDPRTEQIRTTLFDCFFKLKHVANVASRGEHLNRECSLFTDNGRYVIVGSASYISDDSQPLFYDIYRNNESVSPNTRSPLENYSLHIVDLTTGKLCDSRQFKCDKIFLSHNQGLYLYHETLAVLSVQQQTIHIFHIDSSGIFIEAKKIGRFCYEDDELLISRVQDRKMRLRANQQKPFFDATLNSLKHRLLTFLYRRACSISADEGNRGPLMRFYQHFDQLQQLRMWKMQLLDESHLLIKYASEEVVTLRVPDPNSPPSFFVLYNLQTTELLAVYENTCEQLLELFENFTDLFRNAMLHAEVPFNCSASSNIYARQLMQRFKVSIENAIFGGPTEAVKRLLAQLPISSQSFSSSPYLDLALFSYDDKWMSLMERPKACGDHPIRYVGTQVGYSKMLCLI